MNPKKQYNRALFYFYNLDVLLLSTLSVVWGLWIGLPFSPLYLLATAGPGSVNPMSLLIVGAIFVVAGSLKIFGIYRKYPKILEWGAMVGVLGWLWVFWLQIAVGVVSPGLVLFPFFAIHNGWTYLKSRLYDVPLDNVTLSRD